MKRILSVLLTLFLCGLFSGCRQVQDASLSVDDVSVFYGVSSYAMSGADEMTLEYLASTYDNLQLEPVDGQMDLASMITVNLFYQNQQVASFSVDKTGSSGRTAAASVTGPPLAVIIKS